MKRFRNRKMCSFKNESVEDPHELLLSLVDLGSLDAEEALLACVREMSDAECKRVLSSLSLPLGTEEVEVAEPEVDDDLAMLDDDTADDEVVDEFDDEDSSDDEVATECNRRRELEAKLRRLERAAFKERFNRSRMRSRK